MNLTEFIKITKLQPADCLILKKQPVKLLDQYMIYLGMHRDEPLFLANYIESTRFLTKKELAIFSKDFASDHILRFNGNKLQRKSAVDRALHRGDSGSYHLIVNNCMHFSRTTQITKRHTEAEVLGKSLFVTGMVTAGASKKEDVKSIGLFAALLGLMALATED